MSLLPEDRWAVGASPTLRLAQRANGAGWRSLSTPSFADRTPALPTLADVTRQLPPDGGKELQALARATLFEGWDAPGHACVLGAGAKAVLYAIARAVLRPGDQALIVAPYWPTYVDLCRLAFAEAIALETRLEEGFALPLDRLEAALAEGQGRVRLVILSNPNNPTGVLYPAATIAAAERLVTAAGAFLVLDESFAQVRLDEPAAPPTPTAPGPATFVVNSFSKSFHLQGLRLAACLAPEVTAAAVTAVHQTVNGAVSSASAALLLAMAKGGLPLEPGLGARWQRTRACLDAMGLAYVPPQGTFYVFPRLPEVERLEARLEAARLLALDGRVFGEAYADHLRLCFMKPEAELQAMLDDLQAALRP